jgi:hypothetical protein
MSCDWQCPNPASFQGSCDQTANFSLAAASIRVTPISNVLWIKRDSGVSRNRASIRVAVAANAFISSSFPSTSPAASCGALRPFWLHSCNLDVECLTRKSTQRTRVKLQLGLHCVLHRVCRLSYGAYCLLFVVCCLLLCGVGVCLSCVRRSLMIGDPR